MRVMPIFLPLRSLMLLISGRAIKENTNRLAAPASMTTSTPFKGSLDGGAAVRVGKSHFSRQHGLNSAGSRRDVDQFHIQPIFLEESFLLGNPTAAHVAGEGCPTESNFRLGRRGHSDREERQSSHDGSLKRLNLSASPHFRVPSQVSYRWSPTTEVCPWSRLPTPIVMCTPEGSETGCSEDAR